MSETPRSDLYRSSSSRLIPSTSRLSSVDLDFNLLPQPLDGLDSMPPRFSKSVDFNLTITDKKSLKRCIFLSILVVFTVLLFVLLSHFLIKKNENDGASKNLTLALSQAFLFFDAQKSGYFPENSPIKFRGNSGLNDGKEGNTNADLVGGFYDSGNNIKFSFSTAYTVTLLSWTVIEYHKKYEDIGELDHIKDIIKWGSDYLLKTFIPPNSDTDSAILYSQVGGSGNGTNQENDLSCWQRPEDMKYPRQISICDETAADLTGEIVAALSAASLVFLEDKDYSKKLVQAAEKLFVLVAKHDPSHKLEKYTENDACGSQARYFYKSSGYIDELVWGGTWLFFATGNTSYLKYATDNFVSAEEEELDSEKGVFYWNNKLTANAILMTRIRYFMDLGYPYEDALATNRTDLLMCSYLCKKVGMVLEIPAAGAPIQYAATASFLSKLYSDYLKLLSQVGGSCGDFTFTNEMLEGFAKSGVNYILGDNPMQMSYMVGYGDNYPNHVHHRSASTPWDGKWHACSEGNGYLHSREKNPNILVGGMVGGPDINGVFLDERDKPWFTEPSIASNAGLVAALVALLDSPIKSGANGYDDKLGIDKMGIFRNFHL